MVLSWADGEEYRTVPATLRDISLGGGSATVAMAPVAGTPVWFRLKGDDSSPWVGASVIRVSRTGLLGRGPRLLRWKFSEACPYDVFKAAIDGFSDEVQDEDLTWRNLRGEWR